MKGEVKLCYSLLAVWVINAMMTVIIIYTPPNTRPMAACFILIFLLPWSVMLTAKVGRIIGAWGK